MSAEAHIRQLSPQDQANLSFLVNNAEYIYRHLDWRTSFDWLGSEPFLGLERHQRLVSTLACPINETSIRWIRLFAFLNWNAQDLGAAWSLLFQQLLAGVSEKTQTTFAALGLLPWFSELLESSGFIHRQDIIVLHWEGVLPDDRPLAREIRLRPMHLADISDVAVLDQAAFAPLWHQTRIELEQALSQAAYATVATLDQEIIGYQISTSTPFHAHLARLADHPDLQRLSVGYAIVQEFLEYFVERGVSDITVNTQSDNYSSQKLYQKLGFHQTGEAFPVYTLPVN
jgi:ribosomal protein S18 acetylase RimI-like enzyme